MSLQKFLSSRAGKRFYNFAYCWGACLVILGAVFKIAHFPYDNVFLMIGLVTEVTIFFISGFDEPAREYKWERIFPELNKRGKGESNKTTELSISPKDFMSSRYAEELKKLEVNAEELNKAYEQQLKEINSYASSLKPATTVNIEEEMTNLQQSLKQLAGNIDNLNQKYSRIIAAMNPESK